jgi:aspartyl-tRNA(Asn)/glutamyl-tRNA(Gln) amidotransferase subunit B
MDYELVIGLEVHVQLNTQSKAFCRDRNEFGAPPNTRVSSVSLALPGTLPTANLEHLRKGIQLGLALNCEIAPVLGFDRKHYFYPDLPKGYQISQHRQPLCRNGWMGLRLKDDTRRVRIHQIHLEEDAGKSMHEEGEDFSRIDLNRAGAPLLEIVTEPDLRSPEEVDTLMSEMRRLVRWLDISDGHMEQGSLRCDCNISIRPIGADYLMPRCEIKNLNSMRYARQAIRYERQRQIELLESGQEVEQETRQFDPSSGTTRPLRDKEDAQDYRYLPEPDLPAVEVAPAWVQAIGSGLPELPDALFIRLQKDYGLTAYQANLLIESRETAGFFLELAEKVDDYGRAANLVINQVLPALKENGRSMEDFPLSSKGLAELLRWVDQGHISYSLAMQQLYPAMLDHPDKPVDELAREMELFQLSDEDELESVVMAVLKENPGKVKTYQAGKKGLLGFFMGQIMQKTRGKADPKRSKKLLQEQLDETQA